MLGHQAYGMSRISYYYAFYILPSPKSMAEM